MQAAGAACICAAGDRRRFAVGVKGRRTGWARQRRSSDGDGSSCASRSTLRPPCSSSLPRARPLTIVTPRFARPRARLRARERPSCDASRVPTMATPPASAGSGSPRHITNGGRWWMPSSWAGYSSSKRVTNRMPSCASSRSALRPQRAPPRQRWRPLSCRRARTVQRGPGATPRWRCPPPSSTFSVTTRQEEQLQPFFDELLAAARRVTTAANATQPEAGDISQLDHCADRFKTWSLTEALAEACYELRVAAVRYGAAARQQHSLSHAACGRSRSSPRSPFGSRTRVRSGKSALVVR